MKIETAMILETRIIFTSEEYERASTALMGLSQVMERHKFVIQLTRTASLLRNGNRQITMIIRPIDGTTPVSAKELDRLESLVGFTFHDICHSVERTRKSVHISA